MTKKERAELRRVIQAMDDLPASVEDIRGGHVNVYLDIYRPLCVLVGDLPH